VKAVLGLIFEELQDFYFILFDTNERRFITREKYSKDRPKED
jgi:hypothetical protein